MKTSTIFNRFMVITVVIVVAYILTVIIPFFSNELHLQPPNDVAFGMYDPKGFPPYNSETLGEIVLAVATVTQPVLVLWGIGVIIFTLIFLLRHWQKLTRQNRMMMGGILLSAVLIEVFVFSPFGKLLFVWIFD